MYLDLVHKCGSTVIYIIFKKYNHGNFAAIYERPWRWCRNVRAEIKSPTHVQFPPTTQPSLASFSSDARSKRIPVLDRGRCHNRMLPRIHDLQRRRSHRDNLHHISTEKTVPHQLFSHTAHSARHIQDLDRRQRNQISRKNDEPPLPLSICSWTEKDSHELCAVCV